MTLEMQQALERQLEDAVKSGDALRVQQAQSNILIGLMDCQRKTAERVKKLSWKFFAFIAAGGSLTGIAADKLGFLKFIFN